MDRRHFITGSLGVLVTTGLGAPEFRWREVAGHMPEQLWEDEPTTLTLADIKALHDHMKRHGTKL